MFADSSSDELETDQLKKPTRQTRKRDSSCAFVRGDNDENVDRRDGAGQMTPVWCGDGENDCSRFSTDRMSLSSSSDL